MSVCARCETVAYTISPGIRVVDGHELAKSVVGILYGMPCRRVILQAALRHRSDQPDEIVRVVDSR